MNPTEYERLLNWAYRERAHLVAMLARMYPSAFWRDDDELDFPVIYIDTPAGQLSWHINPVDLDLFEGIPWTEESPWDRHTTVEKYERLKKLPLNYIHIKPDTLADLRRDLAAAGIDTQVRTYTLNHQGGFNSDALTKYVLETEQPDDLS